MAVERRDPLPVGMYYTYILASESSKWDEWTKTHVDSVRTIATQAMKVLSSPGSDPIWQVDFHLNPIEEIGGYWIQFEVTKPTPWVGLGFPSVITDRKVHGAEEFLTAPAPGSTEAEAWSKITGLVLLGGAIFLAGSLISRSR